MVSKEGGSEKLGQSKAGSKITISIDQLQMAAAKVIDDPKFRAMLDKNPVETLKSIGIELDEATRKELEGKTLSEVMTQPKLVAKFPWVKILTGVATAVVSIAKTK
jgi:hypothetical protein